MDAEPLQPFLPADPPASPRGYDPARMVYWLLPCLIHATALAWLSVEIQRLFAPFLIFPLLLGVVFGAACVGVMWFCQMAARRGVVTGTLVLLVVLVVGQHYFAYRRVQSGALEQIATLTNEQRAGLEAVRAAMPDLRGPQTFTDFLQRETQRGRPLISGVVARGAGVWLTWGLDAVLVLAGSMIVILPALRRPYCTRCRSWYRSVQSGSLEAIDETDWRQLRQLWPGAPQEWHPGASFDLLACRAGCGPVLLKLSWKRLSPRIAQPPRASIWLTRHDDGRLRAWLGQTIAAEQDTPTSHGSGAAR